MRGAGLLLAAVSLFCYYQFGKILESYWGTFRFNLYYLTGLVLTDLAALLLGSGADASALNLSCFSPSRPSRRKRGCCCSSSSPSR